MGANWWQWLQGIAEKLADTGQGCMSRCAWWLMLAQDDVAVQSRLESGRGTLFTTRASNRDVAHSFSLHPSIMLPRKDRQPTPSPTQSLLVQKKSSSSYGIFKTYDWGFLKEISIVCVIMPKSTPCVSLCPRTVDWLKSHSVRFNVALEYGFIVNWFYLRSCLRCIICFLEYQLQHLKGVSVRQSDASRGQCITVLNLFYLIW